MDIAEGSNHETNNLFDNTLSKSEELVETVSKEAPIKVNGDHNVAHMSFQPEPTCSSSNSSSPHNLVIDQPEDVNCNIGCDSVDHEKPPPRKKKRTLMPVKRKLKDNCDSRNPKKRHFADLAQNFISNSAPFISDDSTLNSNSNNVYCNNTLKPKRKYIPIKEVEQPKIFCEQSSELCNYNYVKPAVTYKCFKCGCDTFQTLLQLRCHQKVCLFKENHKHSSQDWNTTDNYNPSSNNVRGNTSGFLSNEDIHMRLEKQYIDTKTTAKAKKKVFLCAACKTYYENWNLFLHMREVHKRHICLYCVGMFPTAERLTLHLEMKHDLEQNHFESHEKLLRSSTNPCYIMCCTCEHIFTEHDDFQDHNCSEMSITCAFCGQKGRHTSNCKSLQREQVSNEKPKKKKRITKRKSRQSTAPESATNTNQSITDNSFIVGNSCSTLNNKTEISFNSSIKMNGFVDTGSAFGTGGEILNQPNPVEGNELVPLNLSSEKQFLKDPVISGGENPPVEGYSRIVPSLEGNSSEKRLNETEYSSGVGDNKQMDVSEANNRQETNTLSLKDQEVFSTVTQDEEAPKTHDAIISNDTSPDDPMSEHISELEKPNDNMSTSSTEGDGQQQDQQDESRDEETQPKIVPKFKIKIPKDYQAPVESDHSEEESEEEVDEGIEASGNGSEIMDDCPPPIKPDINIINSLQVNTNLLHNNPIDLSVLPENLFEDDKSSDVSDIVNLTNQRALEAAVQETINPVSTEEVTPPEEYLPAVELQLNRPLDKIPIVEFLRICLGYTHPICLYCNHARRIAVNGGNLAQHMITQHKFSATVDSITAEELQPPTIIIKLRNALDEIGSTYFNMETYCSMEKKLIRPFEKIFECFLCRFETRIHKELYLHNRKMHLRTAILCFMCRATFYTFSSILCHMCPGKQNYIQDVDIRFRCCFCEIDDIPSAFRLMVHLRKKHFACDVCLEDCQDQNRLSSHVWKHKLHHFCYRCGIGYRNKPDITKHLFWKHGTESVLCKRCLQKRWPHIYHFCIPPASFVCEVCNLAFSKAMYLKVHKRLHNGENPYTCTEENCDKQFISKKLLTKHLHEHKEPEPIQVEEENKSAEVKDKVKWDEEKKEQGVEGQVNVDIDSFKKKRRKVKKEEDNIADLMDLPVPNLSESDSSDEFDSEKIKQDNFNLPVAKVMLSSPSDAGDDDKLEDTTPMMDIWENFKSFQASRTKQKEEDLDEETEEMQHPPILHVSQSDHDYCMMYKPISKEDDMLDNIEESKKLEDITKTFNETSPSKKKQKSPRKSQRRSVSSSSRSSSSSGSSSSTCRSNCSCCSASGSGSGSSSSSDDSDSSTSEGRRRIAAKKKAKAQKRSRNKSGNSSKNNNSDVVDVVNPDPKFPDTINFNSIILETDLETDESDTDEDFYDENPQKLALQHLEEKRKLLIEQTCLSPLRSYASIDNTEVPTPSCSEEAPQEKKVKIKKKKRDKRTPKNSAIPTFKLNIPAIANIVETLAPESPKETSMIRSANVSLQQPIGNITEPEISTPMLPHLATVLQSRSSTPIPAPVTPKNRLSTGSSSDADATLKRSKRARRPNKFYGYTSDDDSTRPLLTGPAAFKPTPPPNLTWRKEDLPTPPRSQTLKIKSSGNSLKKGTPTNTPPLPPIPPIIIRPSTIIPTKAPVIDQQRPPIVEPMRVPPVPVHHIQLPQQHGSSRRESMESDSSDEDRLHIPYPVQYNTQRQENANSALLKTIPAISTLPPPAPVQTIPPALLPNPDLARIQYFQRNNIRWPIRPPIGARPPREGESVYCYCRCPYDEVSEMIACDGDDCMIEWFHFECVGILVPPKGKWFCPECRPRYSQDSMNYQNT